MCGQIILGTSCAFIDISIISVGCNNTCMESEASYLRGGVVKYSIGEVLVFHRDIAVDTCKGMTVVGHITR